MIKIKNLFYSYDKRFSALYNINLEIDDADKILFFSDSELNSKTLFRILSKQDKDYVGEVFFDGKNLKEIAYKNLSISYITEPSYFLKFKSIKYNIAYPLIIRKIKKKNSFSQVDALLNKYELEYLKNKKIKTLTNYEKILVSLLRAIVRQPNLILIDNIFKELNNEQVKTIINLIKDLKISSNILISINDENLIKLFNDYKIVHFNNGSIIYSQSKQL